MTRVVPCSDHLPLSVVNWQTEQRRPLRRKPHRVHRYKVLSINTISSHRDSPRVFPIVCLISNIARESKVDIIRLVHLSPPSVRTLLCTSFMDSPDTYNATQADTAAPSSTIPHYNRDVLKTPPPTRIPQAHLEATPRYYSSSNVDQEKVPPIKFRQHMAKDLTDRALWISYDKFMEDFVPGPDPTAAEEDQFSKFDSIEDSQFDRKEGHIYTPIVSHLSTHPTC